MSGEERIRVPQAAATAAETRHGEAEDRPPAATPVDRVDCEDEASFPASDPPSWSGLAAVRNQGREAPPAGEQAAWSIEREAPPIEREARPHGPDGGGNPEA